MSRLPYYLRRTLQGFRAELFTNVTTVFTLAIAFLSLGAIAIVAAGLGSQASRWGGENGRQVTLYLRPDAAEADVEKLRAALVTMPEVRAVDVVPGAEARARLVDAFPEERTAWEALDAGFFPGYVEIGLDPRTADEETYRGLVSRVSGLSIVDDVETHGDWYARVLAIHGVTRVLAVALGSIVVFATVFVVSHTIRLNFHRRRRQVEVMKMCGATNGFIRVPFLLEGALQGLLGAALALGALAAFVAAVGGHVADVAPILGDSPLRHLPPEAWAAFMAGGVALGATGAHLSLRRVLEA